MTRMMKCVKKNDEKKMKTVISLKVSCAHRRNIISVWINLLRAVNRLLVVCLA